MGRHSAAAQGDIDDAAIGSPAVATAGDVDDLIGTGRHVLPDLDVLDPVERADLVETGRHYFPDLGLAAGTDPAEHADSPSRPGQSGLLAPLPVSDPAPGVPRTSRAGRDLPAAIGVSAVLAAAVAASVLFYRPVFVWVVCVAIAYATFEMVRALATAGIRAPLVPLVAGGLAMDVAAWFQGGNGLVLGLLLTVVGVLVWRLDGGVASFQRDATAAAFIAVYIPLLGGFAVLLAHPSDGAGRVLAFIATVVCSDTGGYVAGVLFGRHPMAPAVSPKKSWEGFAGSLFACAVAGALLMSLTFHRSWLVGVLFGVAIAVTATVGDLGESMIKRDIGVKDMGRLLPGHGGLMDRLDSLLPCAAVAYLIFAAALT